MPACLAEERGAKVAAQTIIDENFGALGNTEDERRELLLWITHLERGLTGNEVVREAKRFAQQRGEPIHLSRRVALRKLYNVRETLEFKIRFARYI